MIITGVDPDLSGGIVTVDFVTKEILQMNRMPDRKNANGKRELDCYAAWHFLRDHRRIIVGVRRRLVIESAITKPQLSGKGFGMTKGIDTAHQTYGALRALSEALWTPEKVKVAWPSTWKKDMGLSSDKEQSLEMAMEKWPSHSKIWAMKKNAGLAEAILLTEWHYHRTT